MNKKEFNTMGEDVKLVYNIFKAMKFKRYQEFPYTKDGYSKRIKFTYEGKVTQEIYLTEIDYKNWRKLLDKLVKTN